MISIIICSTDRAKFDAVSGQYRRALGSEPCELIGIHDARSMCDGYRRGMAVSKGEILVFSHDDVEIWTPEFAPRLKRHLETFDAVGVAGTTRLVGPGWVQAGVPHIHGHIVHALADGTYQLELYGVARRVVENIHAADGVFLAFRRGVIETVGWDAETFDGFHLYDIDCTYRAHRAGYRLAVVLDLPLAHRSGGSFDDGWQKYAERFVARHGSTLEQQPTRGFQWAAVRVTTAADAMQVLQDCARAMI